MAATTALAALGANDRTAYTGTSYQDSRYHGGAQAIPGRVNCAYYDRGGEGIAYHDSDAKNNGSGILNPADGNYLNQFRMDEGVDISYTKFHDVIDNSPYEKVQPPINQLYVGWTEPGEWFNITVNVAEADVYTADLLYTSNRGGTIAIDVNGKRCDRTDHDRDHIRCVRPSRLAAMASLEHRAGTRQTQPSGWEKCPHGPHPHRRKHEPGLLQFQNDHDDRRAGDTLGEGHCHVVIPA